MCLPCVSVYLTVLQELRNKKSTDLLEQMLPELPNHTAPLRLDSTPENCLIREIMAELLTEERFFPYFQKMLGIIGLRILLHPSCDNAPHLLIQVTQACSEEYMLGLYRQLAGMHNMQQEAESLLAAPFAAAYRTGKYQLLQHLYTQAYAWKVEIDEGLCEGLHPLCFAADRDDPNFARIFLEASKSLKNRGICRGSRKDDPNCVNSPTVLEYIAASGSTGVMRQVLRYGGNPQALTRQGCSLLDVSGESMKQLLLEAGAVPTDPMNCFLHKAILGIWQQDPQRMTYIEPLLSCEIPHTVSVNTETDVAKTFWCLDLVEEALAFSDNEVLERMFPDLKNRLYDRLTIRALQRAFNRCTDPGHALDRSRLLTILEQLAREGLQFSPHVQNQIFVLQTLQDLLISCGTDKAEVPKFCHLLCRIFSLHPVETYRKACTNIYRVDFEETIPTLEETEKLFHSLGWREKRRKPKNKEATS